MHLTGFLMPKNNKEFYLKINGSHSCILDIAAVYNELKKNDSAEFYIKISLNEARQRNDLSYLANTYFIYGGICSDLGQTAKGENF